MTFEFRPTMLDRMKAKPYVGHLVHFTNDLQHTIGRNKFI
jgi:hypothetical protein